MTNEEAIKELKEDRALYESDIVEMGDGTPEGQLLLALDMAIEALEKQIPKKCETREDGKAYRCPFCGGEAEVYSDDPYDGYQGNCAIWRVRCYRCGAVIQELTKERAIEAWNRRVDDDEL